MTAHSTPVIGFVQSPDSFLVSRCSQASLSTEVLDRCGNPQQPQPPNRNNLGAHADYSCPFHDLLMVDHPHQPSSSWLDKQASAAGWVIDDLLRSQDEEASDLQSNMGV